MPDFDPQFLASMLVSTAAILFLYNQVMVATGKRGAPQPFVTDRVKTWASKEDHEILAAKVDRNYRDTEERFRQMAEASSISRDKLYTKLNHLAEELSAQRKSEEITQAVLNRLDQKIDRLNDRKADKT